MVVILVNLNANVLMLGLQKLHLQEELATQELQKVEKW